MNPFERIKEMKQILKTEIVSNGIKENDTITQGEHYKRMMGMLTILEEELKNAEYNYEVKTVNNTVQTFDEYTVLQKELNEDVIIFQPVPVDETEFTAVDMKSLADVLTHLHNDGQIKENILLLPPNVNVFRAKLAIPKQEDATEDDENLE